MQKINTKVSQGEVIFFSHGAYSDYSYCGEVIFTKDCDLAEQAIEYRKSTNLEGDSCSDQISSFSGWLVGQGFCLPLECREIRLGEYGSFDDDFIKPATK